MQTDSIRQVLTYDGAHIGIKFGVPASVVTIWQFVSLPGSGVTANVGLPLSAPFAVVVIPGVLVLRAGLSAGYFGTIAAELLGRHEGFAMSVLAYFVPFLVITALPYVILVPLALGLLGFGSLGEGGAIVGAVFLFDSSVRSCRVSVLGHAVSGCPAPDWVCGSGQRLVPTGCRRRAVSLLHSRLSGTRFARLSGGDRRCRQRLCGRPPHRNRGRRVSRARTQYHDDAVRR